MRFVANNCEYKPNCLSTATAPVQGRFRGSPFAERKSIDANVVFPRFIHRRHINQMTLFIHKHCKKINEMKLLID